VSSFQGQSHIDTWAMAKLAVVPDNGDNRQRKRDLAIIVVTKVTWAQSV